MSIDFRCSRCQRLLRTPEGSAGRQTQCPECGEVLVVPDTAAPPGANPFSSPAVNPYQSPTLAAAAPELAAPGEIAPTRIDLGDLLGRTWAIFQSQLGPVVLGVFIAFAISTVFQWAMSGVIQVVMLLTRDVAVLVIAQIVGNLLYMAFQIWMTRKTRKLTMESARL